MQRQTNGFANAHMQNIFYSPFSCKNIYGQVRIGQVRPYLSILLLLRQWLTWKATSIEGSTFGIPSNSGVSKKKSKQFAGKSSIFPFAH